MSQEKREPQASAAQFADSARVWTLPVHDALAKRRLRIRLNHAYTELGMAVYEKHGEQSGTTELVARIANAQARLVALNADIRRLLQAPPDQAFTPKRIALAETTAVAVLLMVVVLLLFNGRSDTTSGSVSKAGTSTADEGRLETATFGNEVVLGTTVDAYRDAIPAFDEEIVAMVRDGRCFLAPKGTRVRILGRTGAFVRVHVLDGPTAGREGYIVPGLVK